MKTDKREGLFVVLSGPSGSGKDTILNELIALDPNIRTSVSATTRPPRRNEIDGVHYHFLSNEEFEEKIKNGEFAEYVKYGDNYYGTLKSEIDAPACSGKITVLVIDVKGAKTIINEFPEALSIFLVAPSAETLESRLRKRAEESDECIRKRLMIANEELLCQGEYKHVVINDVLEDTVKKVYDIIQNTVP